MPRADEAGTALLKPPNFEVQSQATTPRDSIATRPLILDSKMIPRRS